MLKGLEKDVQRTAFFFFLKLFVLYWGIAD